MSPLFHSSSELISEPNGLDVGFFCSAHNFIATRLSRPYGGLTTIESVFLVPNLDPIDEPFTLLEAAQALNIGNTKVLSDLEDYFGETLILRLSLQYERCKTLTYWDIALLAQLIYFLSFGACCSRALDAATYLTDELARDYDVSGRIISIDCCLMEAAVGVLLGKERQSRSIHELLQHTYEISSYMRLIGSSLEELRSH